MARDSKEKSEKFRSGLAVARSYDAGRDPTLGVLEFIDRFLLHALPVRLARCRAYGFWSSRCKGKDLPKIRKLLDQPELPVDAPDDSDEDPDGDQADQQADSEPDETFRQRLCAACGKKTMVIVDQVPKPTVYEMMQLKIWPEQFGYLEDDLAEEDPQLVLPDVAPFLAGGDLFHEAMGFT